MIRGPTNKLLFERAICSTTIMGKVFGTNVRVHVKKRTTGKVQSPAFSNFNFPNFLKF